MTLEWRAFSVCFSLFSICITAAAAAISTSTLNLLGIAPQDVSHYKSGLLFWCKDGSKSFSLDRLNDDFCDCPDGTDEPGTSACPNGRFYCTNQQQAPLWVFSSRVNDGICDCCDGSDEYDGRVQCRRICTREEDGAFIQVQITKAAKEGMMRDRTKSLLVETKNEQTDASPKSYFLQMLELLELVLVVLALWQFYCWTFRGGLGSRKRLPR